MLDVALVDRARMIDEQAVEHGRPQVGGDARLNK